MGGTDSLKKTTCCFPNDSLGGRKWAGGAVLHDVTNQRESRVVVERRVKPSFFSAGGSLAALLACC